MDSITYRADRRRAHKKAVLWTIIALLFLGFAGLLAIASVMTGEWDRNWWFAAAFLFLALMAAAGVVVHIRRGGPDGNYIALDAEGLTYARRGQSCRWPWHDLSTFRVERSVFQSRILFMVPEDEGPHRPGLLLLHLQVLLSPVDTIEDAYEAPIAEILAKLNLFRERALGAGGAPGDALPAE